MGSFTLTPELIASELKANEHQIQELKDALYISTKTPEFKTAVMKFAQFLASLNLDDPKSPGQHDPLLRKQLFFQTVGCFKQCYEQCQILDALLPKKIFRPTLAEQPSTISKQEFQQINFESFLTQPIWHILDCGGKRLRPFILVL